MELESTQYLEAAGEACLELAEDSRVGLGVRKFSSSSLSTSTSSALHDWKKRDGKVSTKLILT